VPLQPRWRLFALFVTRDGKDQAQYAGAGGAFDGKGEVLDGRNLEKTIAGGASLVRFTNVSHIQRRQQIASSQP
jgi:hypothetical protein